MLEQLNNGLKILVMKKNMVELTASYLFVLLFLYAAVSKLIDFQKFRVQLGQSPLLTAYAGWFAWIVPGLEIMISVMLLSNRLRLSGLYAAFSLMVMFTTYIIAILQFSDYIPCSCGGILSGMHWSAHLIFNSIFTLISATAILIYPRDSRLNLLLQQKGDAENL
jgi:predicted transporter